MQKCDALLKAIWEFLKTLNTESQFHSAVSMLGKSPRDLKYMSTQKLLHKCPIPSLYLIAKKQKPYKCLSTDK